MSDQPVTRLPLTERLHLVGAARFDLLMRRRHLEGKDGACPSKCIAVVFAILQVADADGYAALPHTEIAARAQTTRQTALRIVSILEDEGILFIERRINVKGRTTHDGSNVYSVSFDAIRRAAAGGALSPMATEESSKEPAGVGQRKGGSQAKHRPKGWNSVSATVDGWRKNRASMQVDQRPSEAALHAIHDAGIALSSLGTTPPTEVELAGDGVILRWITPSRQLLIEADGYGELLVSVVKPSGGKRGGS